MNKSFTDVKSGKNGLEEIYKRIRIKKRIDSEVASFLFKKYGDRFIRALELVNSRRIIKFRFIPSGIERWVVIGMHDEYLIFPRIFCQCSDFYLSVVIRGDIDACYHLLAQTISEAVGNYEEKVFDDSNYVRVMSKFYKL